MSPYIKGPADKPLLGGEVVRGVSAEHRGDAAGQPTGIKGVSFKAAC
jgi:hypothetical protein